MPPREGAFTESEDMRMESVNEHYLINMSDGRRVLYTKQAAKQINYHPITANVAYAIDRGEITWQEVVAKIKANLLNNQEAWDELLKKKTTLNVRKSTLKPEDDEGSETSPDGDVDGEFDMGGESGKPAAPKTAVRKPTRKPTPAVAEAAPAADGPGLDL